MFLLSGWDLVGALPVPAESVKDLVADNDYRWINRGGYDLLGTAQDMDRSIQGLPKAPSLYGSLAEQLRDDRSFASRLKAMLRIRDTLGVSRSELVSIPGVDHEGVVVMVSKPPGQPHSWQITALNFGREQATQRIRQSGMAGIAQVSWSNLTDPISADIPVHDESVTLELHPLEARLVVIRPQKPS